jgi:hypothetical protein
VSRLGRPVPPRSIDDVIRAVTATLIGLILAIRPPRPATDEPPPTGTGIDAADELDRQSSRTMWGGFGGSA